MKKQINTSNQRKIELRKEIKKTFENMLQDVVKGKVSIQDFTNQLNYNYSQKKMELSGSLF